MSELTSNNPSRIVLLAHAIQAMLNHGAYLCVQITVPIQEQVVAKGKQQALTNQPKEARHEIFFNGIARAGHGHKRNCGVLCHKPASYKHTKLQNVFRSGKAVY